jgi:hypothetical protein
MSVLIWLAASSAAAQPSLSPLTAEERLSAIRQGLVQAALEGATRVESLAWIDGQGVLREGSSFRSGMEVRGVQVLAYRRDSAGQPEAKLQLPASATAPAMAATPTSTSAPTVLTDRKDLVRELAAVAPPCQNDAALRHWVGLRMSLEGAWTGHHAAMAQALGQFMADALQQAGSVSAGWGMLERTAPARNGYERILLGSSADQWPWQAMLTVRLAPALPASGAAKLFSALPVWTAQPLRAELHFALLVRGQTQPIYQTSGLLALPQGSPAWGRPQLDAALREQASAMVLSWLPGLAAQLSCAAVRPDVIAVQGAELTINAGALAGVRAGDEWLLADPQRFPQQILASGVAASAVLARVAQVFPLHAQLQMVAGPSELVRPDWRAWRADASTSLSKLQR